MFYEEQHMFIMQGRCPIYLTDYFKANYQIHTRATRQSKLLHVHHCACCEDREREESLFLPWLHDLQ